MRFVAPLTADQQRELEKLYHGDRRHRVRQRAHAVLLSAWGYGLDQIAGVLRVDRDAVSRWLARWGRGGAAALADAPKSGRPPRVDAALEAEVVAVAAEHPASVPRALAKRGRLASPAGRR